MESLFSGFGEGTLTTSNNLIFNPKCPTKMVIAPFHLGFPLDLCNIDNNVTVYEEVKNILQFSQFIPIEEDLLDYDVNVSIPMCRPLVVKYKDAEFGENTECYLILFTTGLFLVTVLYYDDSPLEDIENYHEDDNSHNHEAYGCLEYVGKTFGSVLHEWRNAKINQLMPLFDTKYDIALIDAYYVKILDNTYANSVSVKYQNAEILKKHAVVLLYTYASYYSILWLLKTLSKQVGELKNRLLARRTAPKEMIQNLKAMGLHIRRLIAETNPFSIRITHDYVEVLRRFRKAYDMESLEKAVEDQSKLLEDALIWFDSQSKERFNNAIGLAALLLSFVSITAVISQLISTIDYKNDIDSLVRSIWVFGGSFGITGIIGFVTWVTWRKVLGSHKK